MNRKRITVLGAGQIGGVIARRLAEQSHGVTLADKAPRESGFDDIQILPVDVTDGGALRHALTGQDIVISACPYYLNAAIAQAAFDTGVHYFDLTEDVATTAFIRGLAESARTAFVPQCGLAPGFICVLGADMAQRFEHVDTLSLRVGALPVLPTNALRYNVTWSVDGLINEYCNPCQALRNGGLVTVEPLDGLETVMVDGVAFEAFNTSGGAGTLPETLSGKVANLSYKSLRYPGHAAIMKLLLQDLRLAEDREALKRILERVAPFTRKDVVVVFVTATGLRKGRIEEESIVLRYYGDEELGAIQKTTAAGCVAMVELFIAGKLPARGFVRQEQASLRDLLGTRAGQSLDAEAAAAHPRREAA
jgi:saccharopine dehydrogenase-like NADP-dependent oxidoreductase